MDSLLLIGNTDEKLSKILDKMGYGLCSDKDSADLEDLVISKFVDLIIVDSRAYKEGYKVCENLKKEDATKKIPIVFLAKNRGEALAIQNLELTNIDVVMVPYSLGEIAAKVATNLRVRKLKGRSLSNKPNLGEINASLRDLNDRFAKEREEAKAIQYSLLPKDLPKDPSFEIGVYYVPLEEVGGDWYFIEKRSTGKYMLQICDVTGHGLSAAFIGCMTKLAITAARKEEPHEMLKEMNLLMTPQIPQGRFVTMNCVFYDPKTGQIEFAGAGHPPALVIRRKESKVVSLTGKGFAIGFFEDGDYEKESQQLDDNDLIAIFTDGFNEAQNRNREFYGTERMGKLLLNMDPNTPVDDMVKAVVADLDQFRDGRLLKDDITLVILKKKAV